MLTVFMKFEQWTSQVLAEERSTSAVRVDADACDTVAVRTDEIWVADFALIGSQLHRWRYL